MVAFWLMQATAQVLFKYGSLTPGRWWYGFIAGNVFGASSIWLLMLLYKSMNPSLALGLGAGGGFLCGQIALLLIFRQGVSPIQCGAMALVSVGMALFAIGAKAGVPG